MEDEPLEQVTDQEDDTRIFEDEGSLQTTSQRQTADPETFRQREEPQYPIRWTDICSETGEAALRRGLRYVQESFRATARVH